MAKGYGRMPGMGGGMNMNMIKQAQKMQQDMLRMQQELQEKEYSAPRRWTPRMWRCSRT